MDFYVNRSLHRSFRKITKETYFLFTPIAGYVAHRLCLSVTLLLLELRRGMDDTRGLGFTEYTQKRRNTQVEQKDRLTFLKSLQVRKKNL